MNYSQLLEKKYQQIKELYKNMNSATNSYKEYYDISKIKYEAEKELIKEEHKESIMELKNATYDEKNEILKLQRSKNMNESLVDVLDECKQHIIQVNQQKHKEKNFHLKEKMKYKKDAQNNYSLKFEELYKKKKKSLKKKFIESHMNKLP